MFDFNPLSPEFQRNPYDYYHLLQQYAPVLYWEPWGMWFVSTHADAMTVLKDSRFGHEVRTILPAEVVEMRQPPASQRALFDMQDKWMLVHDAPTHTRLRGLVHKAFTPRTIEKMRNYVQEITDKLIDAAQEKGQMDIVSDLAFPLPITVIAQMIGVPESDRALIHHWSRDIAQTLELTEASEVYDRGSVATAEFSAYLREQVADRRRSPKDDLLTALVAAEESGDKLTEAELIATVILLLIAGHETTVNLIGSGTLALLRHPDEFARLKANPDLLKNAIEEMLRYDSPVQLTTRWALRDGIELGGQAIPVGQAVTVLLGAANRDPRLFNDPDAFDISRQGADRHLGFGNGIHFCLGAPLARLEGEIAFRTLISRLPNLRLSDDQLRYRGTYVLRGLESLPVMF